MTLTADPSASAYRKCDPRTSQIAAQLAVSFASEHRALVLACLKAHGPNSKTVIAMLTGLSDVAVARRLPELERSGHAEPTGTYAMSDCGRPERVWRACK